MKKGIAVLFSLVILVIAGCSKPPGESFSSVLGPPWPQRKQPAWINKGIVFVGEWVPLQWRYRKNFEPAYGGPALSGKAEEELFKEEHSEKTVMALKAMGVNMVMTSFEMGFGIANEKTTMDEAKAFGKLLHKHGMKMGVYVSALLLPEELYAEFPQAKNWHRILYDGKPDVYGPNGGDGYRYRAFLNDPQYIQFMKRICRLAVEDGADLIHFDTVNQTAENFHPLAEKMFRDWLKKRYPTKEAWFFRSGLMDWRFVQIPHYPNPLASSTFDQPIMQEYLEFKSQLLANYAAEMSTYIHSLNPQCAVEFNTQGVNGSNRVLLNSVDLPRVLPWLDAYWDEGGNYLTQYTKGGRLLSKIRSLKMGQQFNAVGFIYTGSKQSLSQRLAERHRGQTTPVSETDPRLRLAESMAFNRQCLGDIGSPFVYKTFPEVGRRYIRFFWDHFSLFAKGESAADVAVLRTFASMAYNNYATHRATILAEQALIQSQVPFDIIEDQNLGNLSRYKVVILADQESLSDDQLADLRKYVQKGGGIIATGDTGVYDQWRRYRGHLWGLRNLLGVDESNGTKAKAGLREYKLGAGRVAYLDYLTPTIPVSPKTSFSYKYWAPPKNTAEVLNAIHWAAAGKLRWEVKAPPSVAVNAYYQPARHRYMLHLVNYNCWRNPNLKGIRVDIQTSSNHAITRATVYSPDTSQAVNLQLTSTPNGVGFTLPWLNIYSIIAVQTE